VCIWIADGGALSRSTINSSSLVTFPEAASMWLRAKGHLGN
jgi:hypothetical protein